MNWREPKSFSQVFDSSEGADGHDNKSNDIKIDDNDEENIEEEVSGVSVCTPTMDAIKSLCMRSRAATSTSISGTSVRAQDDDTQVKSGCDSLNSTSTVLQNIPREENSNLCSGKESSSSSSSCSSCSSSPYDQHVADGDLQSTDANLEHVSRVRLRTQNLISREGPFSFPRTMGGFPRTLHTPKPAWGAEASPFISPFSDANSDISGGDREARRDEGELKEEMFSDEKIINRKIPSRFFRSTESLPWSRDVIGSSLYLSADSGISAFVPKNQDPQIPPSPSVQQIDPNEKRKQLEMEEGPLEKIRQRKEERDSEKETQQYFEERRISPIPLMDMDEMNVHGMSIRANSNEKPPSIPKSNLQAEIAWMSLQSPIDKINRGRSASYGSVRTPKDSLLYTPEPSQPYVHRKNSMGNSSKTYSPDTLDSVNGGREILEEENHKNENKDGSDIKDKHSAINHSYSLSQSPSGSISPSNEIKSSQCNDIKTGMRVEEGNVHGNDSGNRTRENDKDDALTQCLGLDELLWGSNENSPSVAPVIPNTLNFSSVRTPITYVGYHSNNGKRNKTDDESENNDDDINSRNQKVLNQEDKSFLDDPSRDSDKASTPNDRGHGRNAAMVLSYTPQGFEYGKNMTPKVRLAPGSANDDSEGRRPRSGSFSRLNTCSGFLSLLGSAVRLTPQAAQLTEESAAADALVLMMKSGQIEDEKEKRGRERYSTEPSVDYSIDGSVHVDSSHDNTEGSQKQQQQQPFAVGDYRDDVDVDIEQEQELEEGDSSIFALDYVSDDDRNNLYCDNNSASDRSQDQEISAVLANLVLQQQQQQQQHGEEEEDRDSNTIYSSDNGVDDKIKKILEVRIKESLEYKMDEQRLHQEQKAEDDRNGSKAFSHRIRGSTFSKVDPQNVNDNKVEMMMDSNERNKAQTMNKMERMKEEEDEGEEGIPLADMINFSNLYSSSDRNQVQDPLQDSNICMGDTGIFEENKITQANILDVSVTEDLDLDSSALQSTATTITIDFQGYRNHNQDISINHSINKSTTNKSIKNNSRNNKSQSQSQSQSQSSIKSNADNNIVIGNKFPPPMNPSLVLTRKKRKKDAITEMKEIILKASPGCSTSVALSLGNNRPGMIVLTPKAILVRYEPTRFGSVNEQGGGDLSVVSTGGRDNLVDNKLMMMNENVNLRIEKNIQEKKEMEMEMERSRRSIFTATPDSIVIMPGSENVFQITFSPAICSSGVYSGALKIKAGNKVNEHLTHGHLFYHFYTSFLYYYSSSPPLFVF